MSKTTRDSLALVPPHNIEAEQSVLGSILIDSEAILKIADILSAPDFYHPAHGQLYAAMLELWGTSRPIDLITVSAILQEKGQLEGLGGKAGLVALTETVPSSTNIFSYAQLVKKYSTLRRLLGVGQGITALSQQIEEDLEDTLEQAEKSLFGVTQQAVRGRLHHIREIVKARYEEFANIHATKQEVNQGVMTGWSGLDRILGGMKGGDMVIVAARPSMGKTAFAVNLCMNVAMKERKSVAIFSLEMSKEQIVDRMLTAAMQVDAYKLHKGKLDDAEFARISDAMEQLEAANIFVDDSVSGSLTEIKSKCRRLQMERGLDMVMIDYLQLLGNSANIANRVQEISDISRGLKNLARELRVPVIALSQLSRAVESRIDKTPQLSDLRESGSIEQDADSVMMLYRESYYDPDTPNPDRLDVIVRKNRSGPLGTASLAFKREQQRLIEYETSFGSL